MKSRGRPVLAAISGLFLGLFIALDLLFFGIIPLNSVMITILPGLGLVLFPVLAIAAPIGKTSKAD